MSRRRINTTAFLLVLTFAIHATLVGGCASKKTRDEDLDTGNAVENSYDVAAPPTVGPQPDEDYTPPEESYVLVLGPGLARSFAYVGVLKELENKNVRISTIVTMDLGALLSTIWATSSINNLEWQAHKLSRGTLLDFSLLKGKSSAAPGNKITKFIENSISVKDLAVSKIPIIVVSSTENGPIFERQGNPIEILRGALGLPNIIETIKVGGLTRSNAAFEIPFPSDYARDLGYGKTLCIDVVGRGNNFTPKENYEHQIAAQMRTVAALSKEQLKACDEVVRIPTDGIGYFDFEQKAELIFRGKAGVQKWLATKK